MAATDSSGSITSPVPEMISMCSRHGGGSALPASQILSVRQSLATHGRLVRLPCKSQLAFQPLEEIKSVGAAPAKPTERCPVHNALSPLVLHDGLAEVTWAVACHDRPTVFC